MNKKQEFINWIKDLINQTNTTIPEDIKDYWEAFCVTNDEKSKPLITDSGKVILKYLQDYSEDRMLKSRDIAEGLFISPRGVSGAMRKLVTDGFVEKLGDSPSVYKLTNKGKEFIIED